MPANSRFAVALHILALLSAREGEPVTSARIAGSVNTNPVVIRRLLSALRAARLVRAQKGSAGGFTLARPPARIPLLEIYRAVEPAPAFALPRVPPNPKCAIGAHIQAALAPIFASALAGMERELARATLGDIHARIRAACPKPA